MRTPPSSRRGGGRETALFFEGGAEGRQCCLAHGVMRAGARRDTRSAPHCPAGPRPLTPRRALPLAGTPSPAPRHLHRTAIRRLGRASPATRTARPGARTVRRVCRSAPRPTRSPPSTLPCSGRHAPRPAAGTQRGRSKEFARSSRPAARGGDVRGREARRSRGETQARLHARGRGSRPANEIRARKHSSTSHAPQGAHGRRGAGP